ncbi:MAG: DUF2911 domain-containing protein [Vicinamibacterales bacterium]
MKRYRPVIAAAALVLAAGVAHPRPVDAQRASPHETVTATVDGAKISVTYGRPYKKGRQVAGGLIPFTGVWRTGADEATTLTSDKALMFGSLHVGPGDVTLFTAAAENGPWHLVISKQTGQWGTDYDAAQDLGRVPMQVGEVSPMVEQFTIEIHDTPQGGEIVMTWDTTKMTIPFTVM